MPQHRFPVSGLAVSFFVRMGEAVCMGKSAEANGHVPQPMFANLEQKLMPEPLWHILGASLQIADKWPPAPSWLPLTGSKRKNGKLLHGV